MKLIKVMQFHTRIGRRQVIGGVIPARKQMAFMAFLSKGIGQIDRDALHTAHFQTVDNNQCSHASCFFLMPFLAQKVLLSFTAFRMARFFGPDLWF